MRVRHEYVILSEEERSILRVERVKALEADLCRAELNYEDALSDAERDAVAEDIQAFERRLETHYRVLGMGREENEGSPDGEGE